MRMRTIVCAAIVAVFLASVSAQASTITFYGSDIDGAAADWRTTTTAKPVDVDGDDLYGTDGWATWIGVEGATKTPPSAYRESNLPDYVGSFSESSGVDVARWGYAMIDDPTSPPADMASSTLSAWTGVVGGTHDLLSFTVDSDIENIDYFVMGVMADNLDNPVANSATFMLISSLGNSYEITLDATSGFNKTPDMYFFKVAGAVANEEFTLIGKSGSAPQYTTAAAVTWDSVAVPEPSTLMLLLGGLALLIFRRRK